MEEQSRVYGYDQRAEDGWERKVKEQYSPLRTRGGRKEPVAEDRDLSP